MLNRAEFTRYAGLALRSHYIAILLAAWVVTAVHECSHGLTSKAFGGRATEFGFLLIYYVLPGFSAMSREFIGFRHAGGVCG